MKEEKNEESTHLKTDKPPFGVLKTTKHEPRTTRECSVTSLASDGDQIRERVIQGWAELREARKEAKGSEESVY